MKKLLAAIIFLIFLLACANHAEYIRKNPDFLKPGLEAKAFLKVWGKPDETMAYLDYENKRHCFVFSGGYGIGGTITPITIIWIYRNQKKVLFFQNEQLVGWENLKD